MTKTIETLNQEERYLFDAVEQIWPAFDDNEHLSGLEWESIGVNFDGHTSFGGEIKHFYADCFTRAEIHLAHKNECKYVWSVNTLFEKGYSLGQYYEQGGGYGYLAVTLPNGDWVSMWSFEGVAMPYNPIDLDGFSQMPILMRALVKECLENLEYVVRGNRFDEIKLLALDGQCNLPCPKFVKE